MSSRAAWRLESLGFIRVYRYTAGKLDWFAFGLPMEGELAASPRAGDVMRRDVPTCRLTDRLGEVHQRVEASDWDSCIVVNAASIVLGRLRGAAWDTSAEATVEDVMENGPTTFRPDNKLESLVKRMQDKKVGSVMITNSDGVLMGVLFRNDAEQRLSELQAGRAEIG